MSAVARQDLFEDARATRLSIAVSAGATSVSVTTGGLSTWGPVAFGRFPVILDRGSQFEEHVYGTAIAGDQITGLAQVDGTPGLLYDHNAAAPVEHGLFAQHVDVANEFLSLPTGADQLAVATAADTWAAGTAKQASTHDSPDTDSATTALHHTLGTGANQATPGTHPAATATHGATGAVVGTTNTQTLTNKTLTAPVIGDFTNAQHDHGDADDGGPLASAAWTAYTPTITGVSVGSGSIQGRWTQQGKTVFVNVRILFGAGMSAAGGAQWPLSLPTACGGIGLASTMSAGSGYAITSTDTRNLVVEIITANTAIMRYVGLVAGNHVVGDTTPWAWASGDILNMAFFYEGA